MERKAISRQSLTLALFVVLTFIANVSSQTITVALTNQANPYAGNLGAIGSSNNAVRLINAAYDTGDVCRTINVGVSIDNVTSLNGNTNDIPTEITRRMLGGYLTEMINSGDTLRSLVAETNTNDFKQGGVRATYDVDGNLSVDPQGAGDILMAEALTNALGVSAGAARTIADYSGGQLEDAGGAGGLKAWLAATLEFALPRFSLSQREALAQVWMDVIMVGRPKMAMLWKIAQTIAIVANGLLLYKWLNFRTPHEAAASSLTIFGVQVPTVQSSIFSVGIVAIAATALGSAIAWIAYAGYSSPLDMWIALCTLGPDTGSGTLHPGIALFLGDSMTLSQLCLLILDSVLNFSAMMNCIQQTITVIFAAWASTWGAWRLLLISSTLG